MQPLEVVVRRLDVGAEAVRHAAALLSEPERQRASRFAHESDRRRFAVARAWLRELLGRRLAVRPQSIDLVYGKHGKPALAPAFARSGLRFNVAHAGDFAAYAFSLGREVGIDLEVVRDIPEADDIAARVFSRRESEAYRRLEASDRPLAFLRCWTRKEALLKALGDGLHQGLERCAVSLAPGEPPSVLHFDGRSGDRCGFALRDFSPGEGLIGALATEGS